MFLIFFYMFVNKKLNYYNYIMYEFHPYYTNDGSLGLFSPKDNDIYHSTYGALSESWQKFLLPARFEEYLKSHSEVKVLDICYGIGYNTKTALNIFISQKFNDNKSIKEKIHNNKGTNIEAIYTDNISSVSKASSSPLDYGISEGCVSSITPKQPTNGHLKSSVTVCKFLGSFFDSYYAKNICKVLIISLKNIIKKIFSVNFKKIKKFTSQNQNSIDAIYTDNMEEGIESEFYYQPDVNSKNYCRKILIDAVDTDGNLICISPFVSNEIKKGNFDKNTKLKSFSNINNQNDKILQVSKMSKMSQKLINKKYRVKQEVSILILKSLIDKKSDINVEQILKNYVADKSNLKFLSKYMINFNKFYQNQTSKSSKNFTLTAFLHNIYYRYISTSYKNVLKILNLAEIDLNFHKIDARCFIKHCDNTYSFIFLDAFTPSKCPALWTLDFFKELHKHLEPNGLLLTYTGSAAVRNAMLNAGFFVGNIYSLELKKNIGTIAVKNKDLIEFPLSERDLALINSKAGICYRDTQLNLSNCEIINIREADVLNSNLVSSSKAVKKFKEKHNENEIRQI